MSEIKRVAILFSGGPAPAANAVISTAAVSFLRHNIEVVGILYGYSALVEYEAGSRELAEGTDYIKIDHTVLKRSRNSQGIMIGTARSNPGKFVSHPDHLQDPERTEPLRRVYEGLNALGVDALISIGGDDTLKTANKFKLFQDLLGEGCKRIPVVHLPKTIDNDYSGIDFTFGYFTAVETLASEIRNLLHDGEAGQAYFLAETMGRSAGWLAYGAAIAGEASLVMSVEDITGDYRTDEVYENPKTGQSERREIMNLQLVIDKIVAVMEAREREGKRFGVIVVAEGLAELLPAEHLEGVSRDEHGHIAISEVHLASMFSKLIAEAYTEKTGKKRKVNGVQLGYESRCAKPHAFDVILGSQLGVGSFLALVEKKLDGVMVSVEGQFEVNFVPFDELIDKRNLVTKVRYIEPNSDFHRLARFLETYVDSGSDDS